MSRVCSNPEATFMAACVIFCDDTETDPKRRFKMVWENQGDLNK